MLFRRRISCPSLALLLLLPGAVAIVRAQESSVSLKNERLVPAALNVVTDSQGNSWNIEQNGNLGRVGNSMINSGLALLVNNQQFYAHQALMTADGREFVLPSRVNTAVPGLQLVRRVRMLDREGALRFVEVLTNASTNPLTVSVVLRTNFSGNYKTYLTDQGNSGVSTLGPREGAILVTPGSNQSNRAFLFTLADAKSPVKPIVTSQNKYGLTFQYNLAIPAGQTVSLVHAVAQVPVPREFDRQTLARVFRPVAFERLAITVPAELRSLSVNGENRAGFTAETLLGGPFLGDLGVERGRRDILALGERTRLIGQATSAAKIGLSTRYGALEAPLENIAAIVGSDRGRRDGARVFLRDGQVFSGTITAGDLNFAMASGGKMNLQAGSLDRLVFAKAETDNRWAAGTVAMVETHAGDRLAVTGDASRLRGMTPWGPLDFTLDDIVWLGPMEDEPVGHFVAFKNGMRCFLFLSGETLPVQSALLGESGLEAGQIRSIVTRAGLEKAKVARDGDPAEIAAGAVPELLAAGGQRVIGPVTTAALRILTQSETVTVAPGEVRRLTNLTAVEGQPAEPGGPQFRAELWGGGQISGYLADRELAMEVRGAPWRIPLSDIRELATPAPALTEENRQSIGKLLTDLGHNEWQTREKATEELKALGFQAQSLLREALKTNADPEVRRRIERILSAIQ
jgi:hypothetical protein